MVIVRHVYRDFPSFPRIKYDTGTNYVFYVDAEFPFNGNQALDNWKTPNHNLYAGDDCFIICSNVYLYPGDQVEGVYIPSSFDNKLYFVVTNYKGNYEQNISQDLKYKIKIY